MKAQNLVIVSGYYGFSNLGDEAILEELVSELKTLVAADEIVVLSGNPQATQKTFAVKAIARQDILQFINMARHARLVVSGGGGLFQDTKSPASALFYGLTILLARMCGARAMIYGQGVGPLRSRLGRWATKSAFKLCQAISLRDPASVSLVTSWGLQAELTADAVWCLQPGKLPQPVQEKLSCPGGHPLVGLSLRPCPLLTSDALEKLACALLQGLPDDARLLLLPLQPRYDCPVLDFVAGRWLAAGRSLCLIEADALTMPSQWIALLSGMDLLISMRLHAAIMALSSSVPSIGIAYDPKVSTLLTEFEQPILNLAKESTKEMWKQTIESAFSTRAELSRQASKHLGQAKNLACQNFNILSRILNRQSNL